MYLQGLELMPAKKASEDPLDIPFTVSQARAPPLVPAPKTPPRTRAEEVAAAAAAAGEEARRMRAAYVEHVALLVPADGSFLEQFQAEAGQDAEAWREGILALR